MPYKEVEREQGKDMRTQLLFDYIV